MTSLQKEDSPVAPASPAPKDPLAEIKELISGLTAKIDAMESRMGGKEEIEKGTPNRDLAERNKAAGIPTKTESAEQEDLEMLEPFEKADPTEAEREEAHKVAREKAEDYAKPLKGAQESTVEKAEPVKTLPINMGQKKQEDKELGPDKVSGAQYLNKEDIASIVSSVIAKMGYTETPKTIDPVRHPLEKMEGAVDRFDMASLATMKFNEVNEIAQRLMGGPRVG